MQMLSGYPQIIIILLRMAIREFLILGQLIRIMVTLPALYSAISSEVRLTIVLEGLLSQPQMDLRITPVTRPATTLFVTLTSSAIPM
jgi:hypothetical protein